MTKQNSKKRFKCIFFWGKFCSCRQGYSRKCHIQFWHCTPWPSQWETHTAFTCKFLARNVLCFVRYEACFKKYRNTHACWIQAEHPCLQIALIFFLKLNLWHIFSSYNLSTICTVEMTPCTICYPSIKLNTHTLHVCTLVIMHVCICCMQALDIMRGRNIQAVMDSHLEGNYSTEVATTLVNLASQCLQYEPRDRPDIKKLVSILEPLQTKLEVTQSLWKEYI